jgi:hypothetical protein
MRQTIFSARPDRQLPDKTRAHYTGGKAILYIYQKGKSREESQVSGSGCQVTGEKKNGDRE